MKQLTAKDADVLTAMLLILTHATERAVEVLEEYFAQEYENKRPEELVALERQLKQQYILQGVPPRFAESRAKREAEEFVREQNSKIFRTDNEKISFGEWKKTAERLHELTMQFTKCGMDTENLVDPEVTSIQMFDTIMRDSQLICRIFILLGNIEAEDFIKVESMLKLMGKKHEAPLHLLTDYFSPQADSIEGY